MLVDLKVHHFALMDQLHIQFREGLNILTGETGAGKSILIKSLSLLLGAKSESNIIREGHNQATVEGFFDLSGRPDIISHIEKLGIQTEDKSLIVRRVLCRKSKNRTYVNGSFVTLEDLRSITFPLVEMTQHSAPLLELTSQHESRQLISPPYQRDLLDIWSKSLEIRTEVSGLHNKLQSLIKKKIKIESEAQDKNKILDYNLFQLNEIKELNPTINELDEIEEKLVSSKSQHKIQSYVESSLELFYQKDQSILSQVTQNIKDLEALNSQVPALKNVGISLVSINSMIEDISHELQNINLDESSPEDIEELESRRSQLIKLSKKHGKNLSDVLVAKEKLQAEIDAIENHEEHLLQLETEINQTQENYQNLCHKLTQLREAGADTLASELNEQLQQLNMKGVLFHVNMEPSKNPNEFGQDQIDFHIGHSHSQKTQALKKVASGGELSRILLSLKTIMGSKNERPRTCLFDEVDTGISGPTAQMVGQKLFEISKYNQVICVTHLPQVASFGKHHYLISKQEKTNDLAESTITYLSPKERTYEIARLLSGESITQTSLKQAESLLN